MNEQKAKPDETRPEKEYSEVLTKYRNLLTTKIFEKSEQIKNEFRSFAKVNGMSVITVPDAIEAYTGDKIRLKLTFMAPQPDRAQINLTLFFTSPKEFYLSIAHTPEPLKEFYPGEKITDEDLRYLKELYEDLFISNVYIICYDKDHLIAGDETRYSSFIDIIEELYQEPRKF
jgi:hypothetical protein